MSPSPTSTTAPGAPSATELSQKADEGQKAEVEIQPLSILDLLVVVSNHKTILIRIVAAFFALGVTYALVAPNEYTATARVVEKSAGGMPNLGGLASLGSSFGVELGSAVSGDGFGADTYAEILRSREVRLTVVRDTFQYVDAEPMSYVDYLNRSGGSIDKVLEYTLFLPWTIRRMLSGSDGGTRFPDENASGMRPPNDAEHEAMRTLYGKMSVSIDQKTRILTLTVRADEPLLSKQLNETLLAELEERVRSLRTEKVRQDLEFVAERFEEAEGELVQAEEQLAQFLERNQNPTAASLRFQEDRLRRQVRFKEQLYSNMQSQLVKAQLELQRNQPVLTTLESPIPPNERSAPMRRLIVAIFLILGTVTALLTVFIVDYFSGPNQSSEREEKLAAIRDNVVPHWLYEWYRARYGSSADSASNGGNASE